RNFRSQATELRVVRRPVEFEIVSPGEACLIDHRTVEHLALHESCKVLDGCIANVQITQTSKKQTRKSFRIAVILGQLLTRFRLTQEVNRLHSCFMMKGELEATGKHFLDHA